MRRSVALPAEPPCIFFAPGGNTAVATGELCDDPAETVAGLSMEVSVGGVSSWLKLFLPRQRYLIDCAGWRPMIELLPDG